MACKQLTNRRRDVETSQTWALDTEDSKGQLTALAKHDDTAKDVRKWGRADAEAERRKVPQQFCRKALEVLAALN